MKEYIVLLLAAVSLIGCTVEEPVKPLCPSIDEVYCKGECLVFDDVNAESCDNDVLICKPDYADCDEDERNGCEVQLSALHLKSCTAESLECEAGYGDCDGNRSNGCEQSIIDDPNNCGSCAVKCEANEFCSAGRCESKCGNNCLDFQYCSDDGKCINKTCMDDKSICSEDYECKTDGRCYQKPEFTQLEICEDKDVRSFINSTESLKIMQSIYDMNNPHQICSMYHELIDHFIKNGAGLCSKTKGCLDPRDIDTCIFTLVESEAAGLIDLTFVVAMLQINNSACVKNSCLMDNSVCRVGYECNMGYCKSGDDYQVCNDFYDLTDDQNSSKKASKFVEMLSASDEDICTKYKELVSSLNARCSSIENNNCLVSEDPVILCGEGFLRAYQQTDKGSVVTDEMIERFVEVNKSCWE